MPIDDEAGSADGLTEPGYGEVLWTPDAAVTERARVTAYLRWLATERGLGLDGYDALWGWSTSHPAEFWATIWDYFGVLGERGPGPVLAGGPMPDVRWFSGGCINYARNALRAARTDPGRVALIYRSERAGRGALTYGELAGEVARVAEGLRDLGVRTGDRVAALLPNGPHAIIALLAAASIGAVWSSCSPDFGAASVIDRFAQIEPTVLIAVDGYAYGGKEYRRDNVVRQIAAELPGLAAVVLVAGAPGGSGGPGAAGRGQAAADGAGGDGAGGNAAAPGGSTGTAWVRRAAPNRTTWTCRSIIRCGCSTPRAPPGCPSRSCTVTGASSLSTSRPCPSTRTWGPATCSSGTPRPAG